MTNEALFEHIAMSESIAMIFFTRATIHESTMDFDPDSVGVLAWKLSLPRYLLSGSYRCCVIWHAEVWKDSKPFNVVKRKTQKIASLSQ